MASRFQLNSPTSEDAEAERAAERGLSDWLAAHVLETVMGSVLALLIFVNVVPLLRARNRSSALENAPAVSAAPGEPRPPSRGL